MYEELSTAQLENELQKLKVEVALEFISNITLVENTSLLDSFPPDLFTGTYYIKIHSRNHEYQMIKFRI